MKESSLVREETGNVETNEQTLTAVFPKEESITRKQKRRTWEGKGWEGQGRRLCSDSL